jgi:TolA-binding protein
LQPSPSEVPDAGLAPLAARETAYGLLGQAMAERQQGRWQSAVLALRSLQREFRDSPEASVALVSLGNLLLDDDEAAEALPLFRQYCQQSPSGALVPEAMAGQARALERLQRTVEARALWLDLRRRFPGSVHARTQVIPERQMGAP